MKILIIGAGGVGKAITHIASRRKFITSCVIADHNISRTVEAIKRIDGDGRFTTAVVDAKNMENIRTLIRSVKPDLVVNAVDPRFVMPIFLACEVEKINYMDMAMSLSKPHPEYPYTEIGIKLGDEQFSRELNWNEKKIFALVGMGADPGVSNIFARYASDELFSSIDEIGIRDGGNIVVEGFEFAPSFSIWTTIEECLNPPIIWEKGIGWYTTKPFTEPEIFDFPEGIGPVECVNVEHEEILLIPRKINANKITFKYGLGKEFIDTLKTIHKLGLHKTKKLDIGDVKVSPRDVLAASLPDPSTLGDKMIGKTCVGTVVQGLSKSGEPKAVYIYHVVDNGWSMKEYGDQAVVWQTAINPVIAMELISEGVWKPEGICGPEWFNPKPFLEKLNEFGPKWNIREETPDIFKKKK